jgi:hypothetical protein
MGARNISLFVFSQSSPRHRCHFTFCDKCRTSLLTVLGDSSRTICWRESELRREREWKEIVDLINLSFLI